jgi:RNA polymerase sigma-70 factor, ECF subfamily
MSRSPTTPLRDGPVTLASVLAECGVVRTDDTEGPEASDADLLRRVQRGDVEAFAPVVRRHLPSLRAFVAFRLPLPHLADELAHETFVFGFRHIHEFDPRRPFRAWLRGIAWNLVRAELQRFAREQANLSRLERLQVAELAASAESALPVDEVVFLEECLAELPSYLRQLIQERYHHEHSAEEMAARRGRTREWVRVTLFRVRRQLRDCIESKLTKGTHAH